MDEMSSAKKLKVIYTYPNLSTIKQRGNIDSRKINLDNIIDIFKPNGFQIIEIPADFIKNETEVNNTGLLPCSFLDKLSVEKLYTKSSIKHKYILHTEPELSRIINSISYTPTLNWYDDHWVNQFIEHVFSIIDFFDQIPYALEIHPGKSQKNKNKNKNDYNNPDTYSKAIKQIYDGFLEKYNKKPLILIENRTHSFIKTGDDISEFWATFTKLYPELKDNVGIILDIQQLFTCCDSNFKDQLDNIPLDCIKGFHIHRLHKAPEPDDGIEWGSVSQKIKAAEKNRRILILPEVHNEIDLIDSYKFCKETLKI